MLKSGTSTISLSGISWNLMYSLVTSSWLVPLGPSVAKVIIGSVSFFPAEGRPGPPSAQRVDSHQLEVEILPGDAVIGAVGDQRIDGSIDLFEQLGVVLAQGDGVAFAQQAAAVFRADEREARCFRPLQEAEH